MKPRLRPLLHVVCLIWATCASYRSPGRLTVLLQEICNLLIQQVSRPGFPTTSPGGGGWGWGGGTESQGRVKGALFSGQGNNHSPKDSHASIILLLPPVSRRRVLSGTGYVGGPVFLPPLPTTQGQAKGGCGEFQPQCSVPTVSGKAQQLRTLPPEPGVLVPNSASPPVRCVCLGKLLTCSVPQFPHCAMAKRRGPVCIQCSHAIHVL